MTESCISQPCACKFEVLSVLVLLFGIVCGIVWGVGECLFLSGGNEVLLCVYVGAEGWEEVEGCEEVGGSRMRMEGRIGFYYCLLPFLLFYFLRACLCAVFLQCTPWRLLDEAHCS